jgi:hypothetical protein
MTEWGAAGAILVVAVAAIGHVFGIADLTTLGNKVPMGAASMLFLLALSWVAWSAVSNPIDAWWALPIAAVACFGVWARGTGIGLWNISPLLNLPSLPACFCYFMLAAAVLTADRVCRAVTLTLALAVGGASAVAHFVPLAPGFPLGSFFMSLPSSVGILLLGGGLLCDTALQCGGFLRWARAIAGGPSPS